MQNQNTEQHRQEFQTWYKTKHRTEAATFGRYTDGRYIDTKLNHMFKGWLAAKGAAE